MVQRVNLLSYKKNILKQSLSKIRSIYNRQTGNTVPEIAVMSISINFADRFLNVAVFLENVYHSRHSTIRLHTSHPVILIILPTSLFLLRFFPPILFLVMLTSLAVEELLFVRNILIFLINHVLSKVYYLFVAVHVYYPYVVNGNMHVRIILSSFCYYCFP